MRPANASLPLFRSFWQAGYEGADHVTHAGDALDMGAATGHRARVRDDYLALQQFGIKTVRESVGWRLVERDGRFDFSSLHERAAIAEELGLQILWTFCHYGWPPELDLFGPQFPLRFARFCRAVSQYLAPFSGPAPIYSPINEISFLCWGLSTHMFNIKNMYRSDPGGKAKRQLVLATIAGCNAIWDVAPQARILQCDPLIHIIAPADRPDWSEQAKAWRESQFDAWDMLCGQKSPELGGAPRYLDLLGVNYYHSNQWETGSNLRLWWHLDDRRRMPLHIMLKQLQQRYQRPIVLAETSHVGSGRGVWIRDIAEQAALAAQFGVDFHGICIYPIIDRPDWEDPAFWHRSGLWDVCASHGDAAPAAPHERPLERRLVPLYATAVRQAQRLTARLCPNDGLFADASAAASANASASSSTKKGDNMRTIVVFCHLRWDFVYQRPQQLLTQLAQFYHVVFIEEPIFTEGQSFLAYATPAPNVTVCQPHTAIHGAGFHDDQLPSLRALLAELSFATDPIVWFYTPMALPLLQQFHPYLVVYDCMDELAAFKNSPKQLLQRETALLKVADLVFTGGPSLYEAKRKRHPRTYCFPSSVDTIHFEQARDRNNSHPAHRDIATPRLGYYGVIDERFDAELLAYLADAHSSWQIVLVGPIVKIDPAALPQRANIHYLGQQPYKALPHFLAGWDICLLPFALNEATRFISPTKVLEYMAAELPIVSTAIADIAIPYGDIVAIAHDGPNFVAACEAALAASEAEKIQRIQKMRVVVAATSWQQSADEMRALLESTPPGQAASRPPAPAEAAPASRNGQNGPGGHEGASPANGAGPVNPGNAASINPLRIAAAMQRVGCAIIGAGPTGLSCAYHLGADTLLLEKNPSVGGWCRSIRDKGFTFDHAGHIMFSNDDYVLHLYRILLGNNMHWQNREAWIYSKNVYTRYPFQGALYGLPPAVIKECIIGAIEARYGGIGNAAACETAPALRDCCADGSSAGAEDSARSVPGAPENFEQFIYRVWGAGIARHFALPYNKKLWKVPLTDMETSWLGGRVPLPDLEAIIDGALEPVAKPVGPNARFAYPLRGGFQALMDGFLPHIRGTLELSAEAVQLSPSAHVVALADGRRFSYRQLVSTMPLPELIKLIGPHAPPPVQQAARGLRHVSVCCVNLGIAREAITDKHWIYYPEDTIFHRIFVQGNASPACNAAGGFGLTCEISYLPGAPLAQTGRALIERCVADCIKVGILRPQDELLTANQVDMPYAYVVYDHARAANVALIRRWLQQQDIVLAGRYSEWEYYNSDHAFLAGKRAAEAVADAISSSFVNAGSVEPRKQNFTSE